VTLLRTIILGSSSISAISSLVYSCHHLLCFERPPIIAVGSHLFAKLTAYISYIIYPFKQYIKTNINYVAAASARAWYLTGRGILLQPVVQYFHVPFINCWRCGTACKVGPSANIRTYQMLVLGRANVYNIWAVCVIKSGVKNTCCDKYLHIFIPGATTLDSDL
jgi:hypothetical protein